MLLIWYVFIKSKIIFMLLRWYVFIKSKIILFRSYSDCFLSVWSSVKQNKKIVVKQREQ